MTEIEQMVLIEYKYAYIIDNLYLVVFCFRLCQVIERIWGVRRFKF